jgi:hypothetical protein
MDWRGLPSERDGTTTQKPRTDFLHRQEVRAFVVLGLSERRIETQESDGLKRLLLYGNA